MSQKNFSRRRGGRGMRFRPAGGLGQASQKHDKEAIAARADATSETSGPERLFEKRHAHEIERSENIAAGLPPEGAPPQEVSPADQKKQFREPNFQAPAQVEEEKPYQPVNLPEQPRG